MNIEIPDDEIVCTLAIRGTEYLDEDQINTFLAAFASAAVKAGLEQATHVSEDALYVGIAW